MATSASPGLSDHSRAMLIGAAGVAIILLGVGSALLPAADRSGFTSIAYGDGAAWFTNYDLGTLTKVSG